MTKMYEKLNEDPGNDRIQAAKIILTLLQMLMKLDSQNLQKN